VTLSHNHALTYFAVAAILGTTPRSPSCLRSVFFFFFFSGSRARIRLLAQAALPYFFRLFSPLQHSRTVTRDLPFVFFQFGFS